MHLLLKMVIFRCHVSLPKGKWSPYDFTAFCGSSASISIAFSSTSPAKVSHNPLHSKHVVLLQLDQHAKPTFPWACSSWSKLLFIFLFTRNHYLCWITVLYCAISTSPSITYCWCLAAWNLAGEPPQLTMPLRTGKSADFPPKDYKLLQHQQQKQHQRTIGRHKIPSLAHVASHPQQLR